MRFPGLADFRVDADGTQIECRPVRTTTSETIRQLYRNQVRPLALSRRGRLVFHASAIELDGMALAFAGASGHGKSTLTASFAASGVSYLCDDALELRFSSGCWVARPGDASIRLWDDAERALFVQPVPIAPPVQYTEKRRLVPRDALPFCSRTLELTRFYFLDAHPSARVVFEPMRPAQAMVELVRHSFLLDVDEREALSRHFQALARLAGMSLFYQVRYPRRFDSLPVVRAAITEHARHE